LLESENRDVRPLMPSIVKSLQLLRKLHRSLKPFILLLKWSVGKNIPPLALFMAGHGEVQTEEEIAEAELQQYESESGETLDCQQPLQWWKVWSVNYV